jgi:hypothetical protein
MNMLGGLAKTAIVFGVLTFLGTVRAGSPIPVTDCGQVLDVPAGEYVLTASIGCSSDSPPVTIAANRIHLNTAGVTVYAIGDALAIKDGVSDILIDGGGSLIGGGGLTIGKDRHVIVRGVTLQGEDDLGGSETGVVIDGASDVTLTGCNIAGYQSVGVQMSDASQVTMIDNNIYGAYGVYGTVDRGVFATNSVTIVADTTFTGRGIALSGRGNFVADNSLILEGSGSEGSGSVPAHDDVGVVVTNHSQVRGNFVNQFFFGVELVGDSNQVVGNLITGRSMGPTPSSVNGIETDAGARHNNIRSNLVSGNQADLYESNGPPCVNVWRNNFYQTSGGATPCIH